MSFTEATTTLDVLIALSFFLVVGVAEPFVEHRLGGMLRSNHVFHWSREYLLTPFARAAVIVTFVLLAYPALFGLRYAPEIARLLAEESLRLNNLLGILFLSTLLLPLLPPFTKRTELIVPLQGVIATAAVFTWYTDYLGATSASVWPGLPSALLIAAIIVFGHRLAAHTGRRLGHALDVAFHTTGFDRVVPNAMELLAQAPIILIYGYVLGRQIAI
jgi:hypothetical protein